MSLWRQSLEIARIDLVVERRIGDTFRIILPFAVIALMIFSLAFGFDITSSGDAGPGVFWAIAILFGMQIALRSSALETESRRDLTTLLGLDPAARFLGRSISAAILLAGFTLVLFVAMLLLYSPELPGAWAGPLALALILTTIGLALLSTLAGEVTSGLRNRTALASLIVAPLVIPLVVGASQVLEAMERSSGILLWVLLLTTTDLVLLVAGVGLSRPLEEAAR
ncbi:MAG: heme exporter protein CcmB [Acidimicrobiia bacterium]|nr:heme exporter protein CcmB [Acidimicrobiia bacterium]